MRTLDVLKSFKHALFNVYVALNMLVASVIFFPWVYPRETISGFIGRKVFEQNIVAYYAAKVIDWFYPGETPHCGETAIMEGNAREELYPGEFDQASVNSGFEVGPDEE